MTRWLGPATAGLVLLALAQAPADERVVRYANDALTVRLANAPVGEVLDEIGRQTGAEIQGQPAEAREVSADFEAVPLPEALRRLLGNENFALVYGEKGNLKTVKLLGAQAASTATPRPMTPTTAPAEPEEVSIDSVLDTPVTLMTGSRLQRLVGASRVPLRQVLEVGLGNGDASVRADAVRTALRAVESEPRFRQATAAAVGGIDDNSAAAALNAVAGDHAAEVARLVASTTKIAALRMKANMYLRAPPPAQ
jgi:hypothetical protein